MKHVFIMSLSRSGSTMLDMWLGSHPDIKGFGEGPAMLLDPKKHAERMAKGNDIPSKTICSCGKMLDKCEFWWWLLYVNLPNPHTPCHDFIISYERFLRRARNKYGDHITVIDSSKYIHVLERLLPEYPNIQVIRLIRDPWGWVFSQKKRHGGGPLKTLFYFYKWWLKNRQQDKFLRDNKVPNIRIYYKRWCVEPYFTSFDILRFLGMLEGVEKLPLLNLRRHDGHIGIGNPMRRDPTKNQAIKYDDGWKSDWLICLVRRVFGWLYNERSHGRVENYEKGK